ncbi:hypothetical protein [Fischerella thermalis]
MRVELQFKAYSGRGATQVMKGKSSCDRAHNGGMEKRLQMQTDEL